MNSANVRMQNIQHCLYITCASYNLVYWWYGMFWKLYSVLV